MLLSVLELTVNMLRKHNYRQNLAKDLAALESEECKSLAGTLKHQRVERGAWTCDDTHLFVQTGLDMKRFIGHDKVPGGFHRGCRSLPLWSILDLPEHQLHRASVEQRRREESKMFSSQLGKDPKP